MPLIPASEITFLFSRSGGPGGQNVNKTETRVQLRWSPDASLVFCQKDKATIKHALSSRFNALGEIVIDADETRSQPQNKDIAAARLEKLVAAALVPKKKRRPTRPTFASRQKRLDSKKKRGETKRRRSAVRLRPD